MSRDNPTMKLVVVESRSRVSLVGLAEPGQRFVATEEADGTIVLKPVDA